MRRVVTAVLAVLVVLAPVTVPAQAGGDAGQSNAVKARAALDAMVQALGGQAWLEKKNEMTEGQIAAFFQGRPDVGTMLAFEFHAWPDRDRIEATKHRDVVEFFVGREGWEVTYRGKKALPKDQVDDFLRRRDHSIETVIKVWLKDPNTILAYEGQRLAERHLAEQVTVISPENESVSIMMDAQTHLPLRRVFEWRDPLYHDKNTDAEEYDNYHLIDGIQTPYSITRFKNDDMVRQFYVTRVRYNQPLPDDFWDPGAESRRIKK